MNQPQPNPLQRALARGKRAEPHPDEDVLTAFAEHSLPERERGQVMEHLSHCAECREVLSFAVGAVPQETRQEKQYALPVGPPLRGWLQWVSIAAGVLVVGSAVVVHERAAKLRIEQQDAAVTVAKETGPPPLLPPPVLQEAKPLPAPALKQGEGRQAPVPQAQANAVEKVAPAAEQPLAAMSQEPYSNAPLAAMDQAGGQMATATSGSTATANAMGATTSPPPPQIAVQDEVMQGTMSAKAKSARAPSASAAAAPAFAGLIGGTGVLAKSSARAQWRINAQGQAERSVGYGPWQAMLTEERARMRVVSVSGDEVWLGGESLRLYHSEDNGATWHSVQLPAKGSGEHVIIHIRFQNSQTGTVEAGDGTQWNTVDGGTTWK